MDGILDFFSPQAGQARRRRLDELAAGATYYIPPELRGLLGLIAEANPVRGIERAGVAAGDLVAPDATGLERVGAGGRMLSEMAGVLAPAAVAGRVGMPAAEAIQEGLLGVSAGARDVGRAVAERLNQPGPMPTLYSNPVPGLMAEGGSVRAYHASPYEFDRFDMSKIGAGLGLQLRGRGLYFSEEEDFAREFLKELTQGIKVGDKFYFYGHQGANAARAAILDSGLPQELADAAFSRIERGDSIQKFINAVERVEPASAQKLKNIIGESDRKGRLYEVKINANPEDFLDWDAALGSQPQNVRDAFSRVRSPNELANLRGESAYEALIEKMGAFDFPRDAGLIERGKFYTDAEARAAKLLSEVGVPGVRYRSEGSRNYVVFDDRLISIVRMYGIAGAAALLGMSVADVEAALAAQPAQQPAPRGLLGEQ